MAACREAVPVWIMPLARVAENFEPSKTRFDLVIVDEASQADLMGLIPMYFAMKVVVVGDDEQVSPDAVGQETAEIDGLISSYLEGMTGSRLFDRTYSQYSHAKANFGAPIRLREHFRCAPDIIQFSNALSYDFEIRPLRDVSQCTIRPHVISYKVDGVRGDGKCNKAEAEAVTSLIAAMCTLDQYRTSSIGVVSLLGDEQARLIDVLLRKRIPLQDYVRRRIVCGNAHQFQGDERDVMVLSMVDSPADGPQRLLSGGARDMYKKRYNVAASRARDQMWVVHSLDPQTDLKPEDLRRRLLEHVLHPETLRERMDAAQSRVESEFERQVSNRLVAAGYRVVPQWKVGAYRIDLVVLGATRRLAVECDGDRYHPLDQLDADIRRQEILERLGWTFVRLRGSQFFQEPDSAMEAVYAKMVELGIGPHLTDTAAEPITSELSDEVIRTAAELRRKWAVADEDDAQSRFAYKPPVATTPERPEKPPSTSRPRARSGPTDERDSDRKATTGLRDIGEVTDTEIKTAVRPSRRTSDTFWRTPPSATRLLVPFSSNR
jgi:very-short-patch-repair endonuclease